MAGHLRNRPIGTGAGRPEQPHAFPASGPSRRSPGHGDGKDQGIRLQPVEVVGFIHAKLSRMGLDGRNPYTPDAFKCIAEKSGGCPASIDRICEASLRFASANRISRISARVVEAATAPAGPGRGAAMRVLESLHPDAGPDADPDAGGTVPPAVYPTRPARDPEGRPKEPRLRGVRVAAVATAGCVLAAAAALAAMPASAPRDALTYVLETVHPGSLDGPAEAGFPAPVLVATALDPTDRLATPLLVRLRPGGERIPARLFVLISGLPDGIVPSPGIEGGGTWRVEQDDLSSLEIRARPGYAGPARIDIGLTAVADYGEGRRTTAHETVSVDIRPMVMRDEVTGVREPAPASHAVPTVPDEPAAPSNVLAIRRGNDLFARGDLAGARLFYELAAAGGSVEGALALGRTHDPVVFERMRVRGLVPDPEQAATWYRRAAGKGSREAEAALRALAAWSRGHEDPGDGIR